MKSKTMRVFYYSKVICCLAIFTATISACDSISFKEPLPEATVVSSNKFSLELTRQLSSTHTENYISSPLSLRLVASMAAQGSEGQTLKEFQNSLELKADLKAQAKADAKLIGHLQARPGINTAQAILTTKNAKINSDFITNLQQNYQAKLMQGATLQSINNYISKQSNGAFPKFLSTLDPNLRLVLVNALKFKGEWKEKFDKASTTKQTFQGKTKTELSMMQQKMKLGVEDFEGFRACRVPMKNSSSLLVFLPNADSSIAKMLTQLKTEHIKKMSSASLSKWELTIPKWETKSTLPLIPALKTMGIKSAFGAEASFKRTSKTESLYVSAVLQKASIKVDEDGATATAVTGMMASAKAISLEFRCDRPFQYFIVNDSDGLILFSGQFTGPQESESN